MLYFQEKKNKMNNQIEQISSGGIGQMYLDRTDKHWYICEATEYANENKIPFFKVFI